MSDDMTSAAEPVVFTPIHIATAVFIVFCLVVMFAAVLYGMVLLAIHAIERIASL